MEGGKYYLGFVGGVRTEITADIYNALIDGLAPINNVYYYFSDAVSKVWRKQIGTEEGGGGATPFVVGHTYDHLYFPTSLSVEEVNSILEGIDNNTKLVQGTINGQNKSLSILKDGAISGMWGILWGEIAVYYNIDLPEYGIQAGWQQLGLDYLDQILSSTPITVTASNENGLVSATPFGGGEPVPVYEYHIEFDNGVVLKTNKDAYDSIIADGYYSVNGVYCHENIINGAYKVGTKYEVEFDDGKKAEISQAEYEAIITEPEES